MRNATAFTLIELLAVMSITSVLLVMGVTAGRSVVERSHCTKCLSNLRQVGIAVQLYTADNSARLPDTGHSRAADGSSLSWTNTLSAYLSTNFIGRCPSRPKARTALTYGWNDLLTTPTGEGISLLACRSPASTIAVAETAESYTSEHFHFRGVRGRMTFNQFRSFVSVNQHGSGANYLFVDGHAETLSASEVQTRLNTPNTTFLQP